MASAARLGDFHTCPLANGSVLHAGGPVTGPCSPSVIIGGQPAAFVGSNLHCNGAVDTIITGSTTVFINGKQSARQGDKTLHGGVIAGGFANVQIGD
jgi:uncharacterized Zn-binding protein involved in type VI secretion